MDGSSSQKLRKKDFIVKTETMTRGKKGKREYLNDHETNDLMRSLNQYFETRVEIPRSCGFKSDAQGKERSINVWKMLTHILFYYTKKISSIEGGEKSAWVIETEDSAAPGQCIQQLAQNAAKKLKFHSSLPRVGQSTAEIVSRSTDGSS